jgi:nucleoside phosphorylase
MDQEPSPLAILTPLPAEARAVCRALSQVGPAPDRDDVFEGRIAGQRVVVGVSGVGSAAAERTARLLVGAYRPQALLVAGVAGALDPSLGRGQLAVSRRVRYGAGAASGENGEIVCDDDLVRAARRALRRTRVGFALTDCATVDAPITGVREKTEAWNRLGAGVVDMEAYWAGLVARDKAIPFLSVRVVLDRASDSLPAFTRRWRGPADNPKVLYSLLTRPWQAPQAFLLRHRLSRVTRRLTVLLPDLVPSLSSNGDALRPKTHATAPPAG